MMITLDVAEKITRRRLSYFGHITRMKPDKLPPIVMMHGRFQGSRPIGRPWKQWIDVVEEMLAVVYVAAKALSPSGEIAVLLS